MAVKIKTLIRNSIREAKLRPPLRQILDIARDRHEDLYLGKWLPAVYNKYADQPVDMHKVIFVEQRLPELSNNFLLLSKDLRKAGDYRIHVHCLRFGFVDRRQYEKNCARLAADMATAGYVFLSEGSREVTCLPRRKETRVIQMWHACGAFKRFGMSCADSLFGPDARHLRRHPTHGSPDLVAVSSPEVVSAYAEALDLQDRRDVIRPIGTSRTDVFFDEKYLKAAVNRVWAHIESAGTAAAPDLKRRKLLLYAPTFRGRTAWADTPGYDRFDVRALREVLGDEWLILVKHHPIVKKENRPVIDKDLEGSFVLDVSDSLPIEDLLCAADACITDYSSIVFEYSLFCRPILFYAYDLDQYYDWRGFYYPYEEMTPGPVCRTMEELTDELAHLEDRFDPDRILEFRRRFMSACDGHATKRLEEAVFGTSELKKC